MKIACARKDIYEGVQTAGRAVSPRVALPILSHLLIKTEGDKVRIVATDREVGMECLVEAHVEEEGAMTAQAKVLTEVLASLPEADVVMSVDDNDAVSIQCGSSQFTILGLPADEYPFLPEVVEEVSFEVDVDKLREGIKKTSFAVSQDEARAILTGVLMNVEESVLTLVSTDTHRLCVYECGIDNLVGAVNAIVPGRAMMELSRALPESADKVYIGISQNQVKFTIGDTVVISTLIEGQFPNYQKVLPTTFNRKLIIPTDPLAQSVKRAEIVARENLHRTTFSLTAGTLVLNAESGTVGRAQEEVEVVNEGDDIRIVFNAKYLGELLNVVDTEAIEMELSGELSPALIRPQGQDNYRHVLMPMQLD